MGGVAVVTGGGRVEGELALKEGVLLVLADSAGKKVTKSVLEYQLAHSNCNK